MHLCFLSFFLNWPPGKGSPPRYIFQLLKSFYKGHIGREERKSFYILAFSFSSFNFEQCDHVDVVKLETMFLIVIVVSKSIDQQNLEFLVSQIL